MARLSPDRSHIDDLPFHRRNLRATLALVSPSDATVIEPTDRAHETFQARSRCRTRPPLSQTLAFLHTLSPSWRTVYRFDTRSPRCDSRFCPLARFAIDKAFLFFFFFLHHECSWPCLSFYDKLNFLFRTRQTKGFARFFFAVAVLGGIVLSRV